VRELENVVERAVNLVQGPVIEPCHFGPLAPGKRMEAPGPGSLLRETEKQTIRQTLENTGSNVSRAATLLGISRATLYSRIKKYGIEISRKSG
jgi:DNA-binding NtrC family response regulator